MPTEQTQSQPEVPVTVPTTPTTPETGSEGETPAVTTDEGAEDISKLPAWAQRKIAELNSESRERRKKANDLADAKKAAEEAILAQKEQWKELAESRGAEVEKLKQKATQADELSEIIAKQINAEIRDWPEEVKSMAPDAEVSPTVMYAWLEKARPLAAKLKGASATTQTAAPAGNGRGPKPVAQAPQAASTKPADSEPLLDARRRF